MAETRLEFWGRTVRVARETAGMSQRHLATTAGLNRSTLRRIEAGQAGSTEDIEAALGVLGYELDAVPAGKPPAPPPDPDADARSRAAAARLVGLRLH